MPSDRLIIGSRYRILLGQSIEDEVIWIPDNPYVDQRLAGHADLSVFNSGKGVLFASNHLKDTLFCENTKYLALNQGKTYPNDAKLNISLVGNKAFMNRDIVDDSIYRFLAEGEYDIINVKQGYCACNILKIDDQSIITSDVGVAKAARQHEIDVLQIESGHILLDGFDYGFIGGSAFRSNDVINFTGTLDFHPNRSEILDYIDKKGLKYHYLTDLPIFDIGGAIKAG